MKDMWLIDNHSISLVVLNSVPESVKIQDSWPQVPDFPFLRMSLLLMLCDLCLCPINTGSKDKMDLDVVTIRILTTPECEAYPCEVKRGTNATVMISFKDVGML